MHRYLWVTTFAGIVLAGGAPAFADMRIGTAGPLSNAEALFGNTWQNGMQLAIDEVNAAGGINGEKLELVREDDQGDPKQGTLIAQKFCDDDSIVAVVANFNSGVTIPSSDVYNRCGMPQVTNSSNPKVTEAGYPNLFRPIANDFMQGGAPADLRAGDARRQDRRDRPRQAGLRRRRRDGLPRHVREGRRQGHVLFGRDGDRRRLLRRHHRSSRPRTRMSSITAARCRASACS